MNSAAGGGAKIVRYSTPYALAGRFGPQKRQRSVVLKLTLLNSMRKAIFAASLLLSIRAVTAESLRFRMEAAGVPAARFTAAELSREITSYAVSEDDPFLIAYYEDHGSQVLEGPLHIIRYSRRTGELRRADVSKAAACPWPAAAERIREHAGLIYLDTHLSPSAGCLLVLDSALSVMIVRNGFLLGAIGSDYAIVERSEIHFQAIHPLRIEAYDLKNQRSIALYPPEGDRFRAAYSELLRKYMSMDWCREHNAPCDPGYFDTGADHWSVNETAKVFAFEAGFASRGFGDAAAARVPSRQVIYVFRESQGAWQYREFEPADLQARFGVETIEELVRQKPLAPFQ
jgi:hypothetical protein